MYNKKTWVSNEVITKEALNNMENGIANNEEAIEQKQDKLVSGNNIKTINNQSLIGSGNITISGNISIEPDLSEYATKDELNDIESSIAELNQKIVNNVNNVKDFGASGDGITDDTEAFLKCINDSLNNNKITYVPSGEYIITPALLHFKIKDNQSLYLKGDGPSTILKRKDQTTTADWMIMFRITTDETNTKDVKLVKIENLMIDGNASNQQEPPSGDTYIFEHSASFYIMGCKNSRINNVQIENVFATDAVADHIYIPGSTDAYVDNFIVNNFICEKRNRTRSDLCVTGWIKTAIFSNIKCTSLEYEINNAEGFNASNILINNVETEVFDLAAINGKLCIYCSNLNVTKSTYAGRLIGKISSSSFCITDGSRLLRNYDIQFDNCDFIMTTNTLDSTLHTLNIEYFNNITFVNCKFKTDDFAETYNEPLVHVKPTSDASINVCFNNCVFDKKPKHAINLDRCGYATIENCDFYNAEPIILNSNNNYKLDVTIKNVSMLASGNCLNIMSGSKTMFYLRIFNMVCLDKNCTIHTANSSGLSFAEFINNRKIYINEPITREYLQSINNTTSLYFSVLKGDEFINLNSNLNEPNSWVVYSTGSKRVEKLNDWLTAKGEALGTTDNKPTCFVNKGFKYFDTDLNKNVYWNGSSWIE